jgi:hypothetical protein
MTPEMQLQIFGDPNYLEKNQIQFYDGSSVPMAAPFADSIVEEESAGIRSIPLEFEDQSYSNPAIGDFKKPTPFVNDELTRAIIARNEGAVDLANLDTTSELSDDPNLMLPNLEQGRPLRSSIFNTGDVVPDTVDSLYFTRGQNTEGFRGIVPALLGRLQNFDSRVRPMQNFYGSRFGLDNVGRVASGPMKGYNPVSGGLLYSLSGGRAGQATNVGLQRALRKRIDTRTSDKTLERIRKLPAERQKAFFDKTKELQNMIKEEQQFRIDSAPRDVRQQIERNRQIDSDTKYGLL